MLWKSTTVTDKWHTEVQLQIFKLYSLLQPRQTEIWDLKQHFLTERCSFISLHVPLKMISSVHRWLLTCKMTLHQCCIWRTEVMCNPTAPLGGSTAALPKGAEITTRQTCNVLIVFIVSYRKIQRFAVGPWELSLYEYLKAKPSHSATAAEIETIENPFCSPILHSLYTLYDTNVWCNPLGRREEAGLEGLSTCLNSKQTLHTLFLLEYNKQVSIFKACRETIQLHSQDMQRSLFTLMWTKILNTKPANSLQTSQYLSFTLLRFNYSACR